ncbi:MAG: hypothetical protein WBX25_13935 [Rhodomicrobium sp.]
MRQADVETGRLGADVERAAIGGLHDTWPTAGHDHRVLPLGGLVLDINEAAEFPGHVIVMALGENALCDRQAAHRLLVTGIGRQCCLQCLDLALCRSWLEHPLQRIMSINETGGKITIAATDVHLPRRIAHAIVDAYKGNLDTHYDREGYFVRMSWKRED